MTREGVLPLSSRSQTRYNAGAMSTRRLILIGGALVIAAGCIVYLAHHLGQPSTQAGSQQRPGSPRTWQPVAPGIEVRSFIRMGERGPAEILAVRVNPERCRIRVVDARRDFGDAAATSDQVCPPRGAAINGSFFADGTSRRPLGLLICDRRAIQSHILGDQWGVFAVTEDRAAIIRSRDPLPVAVTQALQAKPRLVIAGRIPHFKQQPAACRSAVGLDRKGRVFLAATDDFLTLAEWASCMRDSLECVDALNLDGGPSTQLTVRGRRSSAVRGGWPVPVLIAVEPRQ